MDETLQTALAVTRALDNLGVKWFLGGSLASSLLGIPRATLDADIVADLRLIHVEAFLISLGDAWYADATAIRDAIELRSSFNLIHYDTAIKVDVFIPKQRNFERGQFIRARFITITEDGGIQIPVCAPEDLIAIKLEWFRLGGELSERQWNDIQGILHINAGNLDAGLLRENANELKVADLLDRALTAAGKR